MEGTVTDPNATVWVVIHPTKQSDYWVQQKVSVKESGKWKVSVNVGQDRQGVGEQFEIKAFANPKDKLEQGMKLSDWPAAEAKSDVVEVTRE